ncbi:hypothetical protein KIN20_021213 [Parelaphostrongylus tenuis]|uniref:Uncharacterized protein n=1 Tax=Parelaphostrongylus tenuis TaxID=148309 RepID=A0AAD5N4Z2_PARTN|nr:hypothetical protein KIN20_021213 [Parelaphostrongylus tenuis]
MADLLQYASQMTEHPQCCPDGPTSDGGVTANVLKTLQKQAIKLQRMYSVLSKNAAKRPIWMRRDIIARRHRLRSCDTAVMEIKKVGVHMALPMLIITEQSYASTAAQAFTFGTL